MTHTTELLDREAAILVVVDVQEAFRQRVDGFDALVASVATLARGCALLEVPVVVTEQYPRGLGATVDELGPALAGADVLEKATFSALGADGFDAVLGRAAGGAGARQAIVCGLETHVCVLQTALELMARGIQVHLPLDAIASQSADDRAAGLQRLLGAGASASSVQTALFELLRTARTPGFRAVQTLVKELAEQRAGGANALVAGGTVHAR